MPYMACPSTVLYLNCMICGAPNRLLSQMATFATLMFRRQKNGKRNERIGHGHSGCLTLCHVLPLVTSVLAELRHLQAPPTTPLNAFATWPGAHLQYVLSTDVTHRLRSALALYPDPAFPATDVSACSTWAGGAMALLFASVPSNKIKKVGRQHSEELPLPLSTCAGPTRNDRPVGRNASWWCLSVWPGTSLTPPLVTLLYPPFSHLWLLGTPSNSNW